MSAHLRHHQWGNTRAWQFSRQPMDASTRLHIHGPLIGLHDNQGFLGKLFRRMK
jgi:hypothetical protein